MRIAHGSEGVNPPQRPSRLWTNNPLSALLGQPASRDLALDYLMFQVLIIPFSSLVHTCSEINKALPSSSVAVIS